MPTTISVGAVSLRVVGIKNSVVGVLELMWKPPSIRKCRSTVPGFPRVIVMVGAGDIMLPAAGTPTATPVEGGVQLTLLFGERAFENLERAAVTAALERADGNQTRAARLLGIQRLALARAAMRLGITTGRLRVRS